MTARWRKQMATKYAIEPCRPNALTIKIRLIDTPGLDESEGKDFENMSDVLRTLNQLAKSPQAWERRSSCQAPASTKPMSISQMRLFKTPTMQAIDKRIQLYLQDASDSWTVELKSAHRSVSDRDAFHSTLIQRKEELGNRIARLQGDMELYDNDTKFAIKTYTTQNNPSVLELFELWVIRSRVRNIMHIKEDKYPEFDVRCCYFSRIAQVDGQAPIH
ncbi:hypothetical protein IL306_015133 [Fusarium sp. DS 682]|nr:hypothetical protein IL306_015133 [Fusarium sp. DS 682]